MKDKNLIFLIVLLAVLLIFFSCSFFTDKPKSAFEEEEEKEEKGDQKKEETPSVAGVFLWSQRLGGTNDDGGSQIEIDSSGNIYLIGSINGNVDLNGDSSISAGLPETSTATYGNSDIFIVKYNSSRTMLWGKRLGGINDDYGSSIEIDPSGNVYVIGSINGNADVNGDGDSTDGGSESGVCYGDNDIFVAKFNSSGAYQWSKRLGGTDDDRGYSITIDSSGNIVYVTGIVNGNADLDGNGSVSGGLPETSTATYGGSDIFVTKYNLSGTYQWAKRLGGTGYDTRLCEGKDQNLHISVKLVYYHLLGVNIDEVYRRHTS